jgi:hypothetical protein
MSPVPIDPVARLDEPEVPGIAPTHGVVVMLGAGTPINELIPALLISVAPRGIVPPLSVVVVLAPGFDRGDAVPVDETTPDDGEEQPFEITVEPMPPPSNDDVIPVVPDEAPAVPEEEEEEEEVLPAVPEEDVVVPMQLELLDIGPIGVGPMPPGSIAVAPSGIPVEKLDPCEVVPGIPSGDVIPMLGVVVCARPALQLQRIATAAMNIRRI